MSKITHEQAKETIQEIQDSFTHNTYYERYEFDTIKNYITQQEELEETIKELQNILETNYDNLIDLGHYVISVRNTNKKLEERVVKQHNEINKQEKLLE